MEEQLLIPHALEDSLLDAPDHAQMAAISSLAAALFHNQHLVSTLFWQGASDNKISAMAAAVASKIQNNNNQESSSDNAFTSDPVEIIPPDVLHPSLQAFNINKFILTQIDRDRALEYLDSDSQHLSRLFDRRTQCLKLLLDALSKAMQRFKNAHLYSGRKKNAAASTGSTQVTSIPPMLRWGILSVFPLIHSVGHLEELKGGQSMLKSNCIQIMVQILQSSPPLALQMEPQETMDQMFSLLKSFDETFSGQASSAMLGLALHRGRLRHILDALIPLIQGGSCAVDVHTYVHQLSDYGSDRIVACVPESIGDIISWHHHPCSESIKDFMVPEPQLHYSTMCCDGSFLYIHKSSGLVKIGSGVTGTLMGNIYSINTSFRIGEKGQLVYLNDFILYRSLKMKDGVLGLKVCPNTLQEFGTVVFADPTYSARDYSHMMTDGSSIYFLNVIDQECGQCSLDSFTVSDDVAHFRSSVSLPAGWTQFPFHRRGWNTERNPLFHFFVGQKVDAKDSVSKWCPATVVKVTSSRVLVHYDGWSSK
jgi:hypothetical protein